MSLDIVSPNYEMEEDNNVTLHQRCQAPDPIDMMQHDSGSFCLLRSSEIYFTPPLEGEFTGFHRDVEMGNHFRIIHDQYLPDQHLPEQPSKLSYSHKGKQPCSQLQQYQLKVIGTKTKARKLSEIELSPEPNVERRNRSQSCIDKETLQYSGKNSAFTEIQSDPRKRMKKRNK